MEFCLNDVKIAGSDQAVSELELKPVLDLVRGMDDVIRQVSECDDIAFRFVKRLEIIGIVQHPPQLVTSFEGAVDHLFEQLFTKQ